WETINAKRGMAHWDRLEKETRNKDGSKTMESKGYQEAIAHSSSSCALSSDSDLTSPLDALELQIIDLDKHFPPNAGFRRLYKMRTETFIATEGTYTGQFIYC
ncbi:hypothetical protein BGZ68_004330, partial [Mortierella alpina]